MQGARGHFMKLADGRFKTNKRKEVLNATQRYLVESATGNCARQKVYLYSKWDWAGSCSNEVCEILGTSLVSVVLEPQVRRGLLHSYLSLSINHNPTWKVRTHLKTILKHSHLCVRWLSAAIDALQSRFICHDCQNCLQPGICTVVTYLLPSVGQGFGHYLLLSNKLRSSSSFVHTEEGGAYQCKHLAKL